MTRRGSLVYYLAAPVVGCFAMTMTFYVAQWPASRSYLWSRNIVIAYLGVLVQGMVAALLYAFLLRLSMRLLGSHRSWVWPLAGAFWGLIVVRCLGVLNRVYDLDERWYYLARSLSTAGPGHLVELGVDWLSLFPGLLTAVLLFRIHRAFEPGKSAP